MSTVRSEPSGLEVTAAADDSVAIRRPRSRSLHRGDSIGRYLVLGVLGEGGMGVVYAAYDPELDRKVAIKFLRAGPDDEAGRGHGRLRLQREAQAMARLTHRNVVGIYDVGVDDERVFVAMELIEGRTLRGWLAAGPRGWREVLAVLLQAGDGLAAAHAAGLVHRDFKPENILVASDGRVCVADFGLAFAAERGDPATMDTSEVSATGALTVPGAVMGTPAYMAPEQFRGEPASAAADIFAFCVTAYEALLGERPFVGDTLVELSAAVCAGELRPPPRGHVAPSRLSRLLRGGLHPDARRRPPSMRALLDAMARVPGARRRWLAGAAALVAACAGVVALRPWTDETCGGAAGELAAVWGPEAARELRAAFVATGVHYAGDTAARVIEGLDGYASEWIAAHTDVCEATRVRGEQSERLLDLRMICLERRRARLAALLELFAAADAAVVERGVSLVHWLPDVSECADAESLIRDEEPAEQIAAEDRAFIEDGMARVLLLHSAGRYAEARASALPVVERTRAIAGPRLRARVLRAYAGMLCFGDDESATAPVREAMAAALAVGDARAFAEAAGCMIDLEHEAGRDMEVWRTLAEAALEEVGGDEQILAKALTNYGNGLKRDNRRAEALAVFRRVLELRRRPSNRRPEVVGDALLNLSAVYLQSEDSAEGVALLNEAMAVWRECLGPEHPRLLIALRTLTVLHFRRGELEEARAQAERSLDMLVKLHGASHPRVGDMHAVLGNALMTAGDFPRARPQLAAALTSARANPSKRRNLAYALANLAYLEMLEGHPDAAGSLLAEARQIFAEIVTPPHPDLVTLAGMVGVLALRRGDLQVAESELRGALEMSERVEEAGGKVDPDVRIALADVLERRGDPRAALVELDRLTGEGPEALVFERDRAAAAAVRARATWALGDRAAALAAAREATSRYEAVRPGYALDRDAFAGWFAGRGATRR